MPRTKSRRKGGDRRLVVALLTIAVLATVLSSRLGRPVRHALLTPVHFLQGAIRGAIRPVGALLRGLGAAETLAQRNAALSAQVRDLRSRLAYTRAELRAAQRKLAGLTAQPRRGGFRRVTADLIAGDASPWRESIVVAAGWNAGVQADMPVVWAGAAVGRVVAVGPATCRVLLLTDPDFRAAVRFSRTGVRGVLVGAGAGRVRVDFVAHNADARMGDGVVTAGIDDLFPANFLVGVCTHSSPRSGELTRQIEIQPHVSARNLETVEILLWRAPKEPQPTPRRGRRP